MTPVEYFNYGLKSRYFIDLVWLHGILSIHLDSTDNKYIKKDINSYKVLVDGEFVSIEADVTKPLFSIGARTLVNKDSLDNVEEDTLTTIGTAIANAVVLVFPFGSLIPYINKVFSIKEIESKYVSFLLLEKKITVEKYDNFTVAVKALEGLSTLVSIAGTKKSMIPPDGMKEFKSKLIKELDEKYTREVWTTDRSHIAYYESRLTEYHKEFLADDPSYGKFITNKIFSNSMGKQFRTFGADVEFDKKDLNTLLVVNPLSAGYPKDSKELAKMLNTSRAGSYDRGFSTRDGGVISKELFRSVSNIEFVDNDCGSKQTTQEYITQQNYLKYLFRYKVENGIPILLTKEVLEKSIGQVVNLRTPKWCKQKPIGNYCSTCAGKLASKSKKEIINIVSAVGSTVTKSALKVMHNAQVSTIKIDYFKTLS